MDINHLAIDIKEWADEVFPARTDQSMFLKMFKEIGELVDAEDVEEQESEVADMLIMLLDYARRKGINPSIAIQKKMRINKTRTWRITPIGVMQHVKTD